MAQATRATSGLPAPRGRVVGRAARRVPRRLLRALGEDRLVALLRGGHEEAFEAIYDRYQAPILSFCRHMLASRSDGEDAAQQTFVSAYRHLVESHRAIALRPWLYAIARNQCVSQLRARRETAGLDGTLAELPETTGLADRVQHRDDLRELLADLSALPEQQRAALVLAELGDLSHAEIAGVLDCEPNKVKALVYQARSSLMADRKARELDCLRIREQLAVGRGHDLLRSELRRHLRSCEGCSEFADEVKRQRRAMAVLLPVIPTAAFRHATLSSVLGSAGGSSVSAGGVVGAVASKTLAVKAIGIAIAAGGIGAGVAVVRQGHATPAHHRQPAALSNAGRAAPSPARQRATRSQIVTRRATPATSQQLPSAAANANSVARTGGVVAPERAHPTAPRDHAQLVHRHHASTLVHRGHARAPQRSHGVRGRGHHRVQHQPRLGKNAPPSTPGGRKPPTAGKSVAGSGAPAG